MSLTAAQEEYLLKQWLRDKKMEVYQRDPERWLIERFGEDPRTLRWSLWPGYENHIWDGTPDPFKLMFDCLSGQVDGTRWVAIESATSTGKTYLLPRVIYWFLDCFPNSLVVTTAPKQQQLKAVLWSEVRKCYHRFKKIRPKAEMFSQSILPGGRIIANSKNGLGEDEVTDMWMCIGVVSGVGAGEESATKMQGYHRENMLFVVEEAAGVPNAVFNAIKNTSTGDNNLVIAVGNPDAATDSLHKFAGLDHVQHITISAYDHPNVVVGNDENGKAPIPGAVTLKSIKERRDEYGELSNFFKSRVRGIAPEQAADALIRYDWIVAACPLLWKKEHKDVPFKEIPLNGDSVNALGVDVANSENGDKAALAAGTKNHLNYLKEFACPNANDLAYNLVKDDLWLATHQKQVYNTIKIKGRVRPERVGVDAVGVGVATLNTFSEMGWEVKGLQGGADKSVIPTVDDEVELDKDGFPKKKPMYAFNNLRSQMWFTAALELQRGEIMIDITDVNLVMALAKELVTVKRGEGITTIAVEGKKDIKKRLGKSPNLGDAFVYWNWMRKQRTSEFGGLGVG